MCLEQEHKSKSKNTKLKFKNHKPRNTNTNLATDQPNQTMNSVCLGMPIVAQNDEVMSTALNLGRNKESEMDLELT